MKLITVLFLMMILTACAGKPFGAHDNGLHKGQHKQKVN